ncbi:MAG: hypothetical protein OEU84_16990 [Xanthomonadales bacterium]|nr:hypothetical protein [Xanthomonadales bacterium]
MNRIVTLTGLCLFLCTTLLVTSPLRAQEKPQLSEEIRKVMDTQGATAAKQRFAEIYPSQKDSYIVDMQAMMLLGQEYMMAGDMEKGMPVMEMGAMLTQEMTSQMYSASPQSSEMMGQLAEQEKIAQAQQEQQRAEEQAQKEKIREQARGKARDDIDRFSGLWAQPDNRDPRRSLWVMRTCDGYLATGATWGDARPLMMRSAADTVFSYSDSFQSFSYEFNADKLVHDWNALPGPLVRIGPVPDEYGDCLELQIGR